MDDLENPNADEAIAGDPAADAPQDPVQAAKDDAWLAQFRADNAAKVMEYDYKATVDSQAEQSGAVAQRDYDLKMAAKLSGDAATARTDAAADDKKAEQTPSRHDEFTAKAEEERHVAVAADGSATHFREEAHVADVRAQQLSTDVAEEYKHFQADQHDYEIMQEQATAAQRIATDEARLPHPGDTPPAEPGS